MQVDQYNRYLTISLDWDRMQTNMKMKMKLLAIILFVVVGLFIVKKISATSLLPQISTACETKNGNLYAFNDGFSLFKKCEGSVRRRIVIIGEQGVQGPKGDTGIQGAKGEKGDPSAQKALKVFDNNGNELGIYMDTMAFFNTTLKKRVILNGSGQLLHRITIFFKSQYCDGPGYLSTSDLFNDVFSVGPGKYYVVQKTVSKENIISESQFEFNNTSQSVECRNTSNSLSDASTLAPVTLPFSVPVSMPLEYRYE